MPVPSFPNVSPATRKVMQANKGKDTKPEMVVRRLVHGMGYRYRLHRKDLPGKPDLAFGHRHKAIFVHGCFWHAHGCKGHAHTPKTRSGFWSEKFRGNVERHERDKARLTVLGWRVLVVWECEVKVDDRLRATIRDFLEE